MKTGYVIAQYKSASKFFTASSSYDRPSWTELNEATVYQSVELAQRAVSKLWTNGTYSASLKSLNEIMDQQIDDESSIHDQEFDDTQYDEPEMTAGTLDQDDESDINLDDDEVESIEQIESEDDHPEHVDEPVDDEIDDIDAEENEQSFLSPIEKDLMSNKMHQFPNGNGPMKEAIIPDLMHTSSNAFSSKKSRATATDPHNAYRERRTVKVTDAEVREMRNMFQKQGKSRDVIYAKWSNMQPSSIDKILDYEARLSPACDIDYKEKTKVAENNTIATDLPKPEVIKYKQQLNDPSDTNFANEIEVLHNPHKTPSEIIKALKDGIKEFQAVADYNNGKDDSQASMAMTICSALNDILTDLQQDTHEGFKAAQIRWSTYMNPITTNFPPEVIDYLVKRGRQPMNLKTMFYDKWYNK